MRNERYMPMFHFAATGVEPGCSRSVYFAAFCNSAASFAASFFVNRNEVLRYNRPAFVITSSRTELPRLMTFAVSVHFTPETLMAIVTGGSTNNCTRESGGSIIRSAQAGLI